jgi:hypothetical protein
MIFGTFAFSEVAFSELQAGNGEISVDAAGVGGWSVVARRRQFELEQQLGRERRAQQAADDEVEERERALVRANSEITREREKVRLAKAINRRLEQDRLTELIAQQLAMFHVEQAKANSRISIAKDEEDAIVMLLMM